MSNIEAQCLWLLPHCTSPPNPILQQTNRGEIDYNLIHEKILYVDITTSFVSQYSQWQKSV